MRILIHMTGYSRSWSICDQICNNIPFPASVAIVGMMDIRDMKAH